MCYLVDAGDLKTKALAAFYNGRLRERESGETVIYKALSLPRAS
jgi:hypothetical protein